MMDDKSPGQEQSDAAGNRSDVLSDQAFEDLVRANINWMLAVARRILQDAAFAEDAVQNAFAKIHTNLENFEGRSQLKTWMHRFVVNEALMLLRKQKRKNEQHIDPLLPDFDYNGCRIDDPFTLSNTSEHQLHSQQIRAIVTQKIDSLPDDYRIILVLRDIEGLTTSEAADVLQLTEANVKVRLHRARAALKKLLEPMMRGGTL